MDGLSNRLSETAQLAKLDGVENVYIAINHSPHPIRLPAHATRIGKALLSCCPQAKRGAGSARARWCG